MLKDKRQAIVNAAIRRFIYYGISKTTMDDIAKDLALTKPSLYYYFTNKSHLVRAVFDHVFDEYLYLLEKVNLDQSLEQILDDVIKMHRTLFKQYALLGCSKDHFLNPKDKILHHKFIKVKLIYTNFLRNVFHAASRKMEVRSENIDKTVHLYFNCMQGMFMNHFVDKQTIIHVHHRHHLLVYKNAREFSSVFIKGLRF